jgi:hypothetical protein
MYTIPTITLCIVVFLIGMAAGSFVEFVTKKKTPAPPDSTPSEDQLANEGDLHVFTAWRTSKNRVWLEMDGARLQDKEDFLPEQRQRLLDYIIALRPWLETSHSQTLKSSSTVSHTEKPAPVSPTPAVPLSSAVPIQQPVSPPGSEVPVEPGAPPETDMDSMIHQIDRVLQLKLPGSPFKERGIQLVEGPGGTVIVMDGLNRYEGIDSVPDPEIRALIHQAVADWEKGTG